MSFSESYPEGTHVVVDAVETSFRMQLPAGVDAVHSSPQESDLSDGPTQWSVRRTHSARVDAVNSAPQGNSTLVEPSVKRPSAADSNGWWRL